MPNLNIEIKLESQFTTDDLETRLSELDKIRSRKRSGTTTSTSTALNKRSRSDRGGSGSSQPPKSVRLLATTGVTRQYAYPSQDIDATAIHGNGYACHLKVGIPDMESHALQLLRIIWAEIVKFPKAQIDDIIRGPPNETKGDANKTRSEKEKQEALLLITISDNVTKMPAKIFNLFKGPLMNLQQL
ncbi:hypothetical protein Tco_0978715 [Tanacetum coccineum]|uniref:Uncharacterized protein n=1 Tax=Tanacetum coccineum TaxID=301880 RepID=A0ABQ5ENM7_9ASTR